MIDIAQFGLRYDFKQCVINSAKIIFSLAEHFEDDIGKIAT